MRQVGFWTAVDFGNHPKDFSQSCAQFFDYCLNWKGQTVVVFPGQVKTNKLYVESIKSTAHEFLENWDNLVGFYQAVFNPIQTQEQRDETFEDILEKKINRLIHTNHFEEAEFLINKSSDNRFKKNKLNKIEKHKECERLKELIGINIEEALPRIYVLETHYLKDALLREAVKALVILRRYEKVDEVLNCPFSNDSGKELAFEIFLNLVLESEEPTVCMPFLKNLKKGSETDTFLKEAIESLGNQGFFSEAIELLQHPFYRDYNKETVAKSLLSLFLKSKTPLLCLSLIKQLENGSDKDECLKKVIEGLADRGFYAQAMDLLKEAFYSDYRKNFVTENLLSLLLKSHNPTLSLPLLKRMKKSSDKDSLLNKTIKNLSELGLFAEAIELLEESFKSDSYKHFSINALFDSLLKSDEPITCLFLAKHLNKDWAIDTNLLKIIKVFVEKGFKNEAFLFLDYFYFDSQKKDAEKLLI